MINIKHCLSLRVLFIRRPTAAHSLTGMLSLWFILKLITPLILIFPILFSSIIFHFLHSLCIDLLCIATFKTPGREDMRLVSMHRKMAVPFVVCLAAPLGVVQIPKGFIMRLNLLDLGNPESLYWP